LASGIQAENGNCALLVTLQLNKKYKCDFLKLRCPFKLSHADSKFVRAFYLDMSPYFLFVGAGHLTDFLR
jgi:hypothetical protein